MSTLLGEIIKTKHPKKNGKWLIIDLDNTMIYTMNDKYKEDFDSILRNGSFVLEDATYKIIGMGPAIFGVKRPNFEVFLKFCSEAFEGICVWSAGEKQYVDAIVEELFRDLEYPLLVYSRGHCEIDEDGNYYKPLSKMFDDPITLGKLKPENTIIIDDNELTYQQNTFNAIHIPVYKIGKMTGGNRTITVEQIMKSDHIFYILMWYFLSDNFVYSEDVRGLDKPELSKLIG